MKLTALFTLLLALNLNAQNLAEILDALKKSEKVQVILEKTKSDIAQNGLISSNESPELGLSLSQVDDTADGGMEFAVGFSQTLSHPFSASNKDKAVNSLNSALKQKSEYEINMLELDVALKYHNTCVSKEIRNKANILFTKQSNRYAQIRKAYELGEISKRDLLFNKLDLLKLKQSVEAYKKNYLVEYSSLQEGVDNLTIDYVACDDLLEISREVKLNSLSEHRELKELESQKSASSALSSIYDSSFSSLGYELMYEDELDAQRYTVGISIPLGFASSQKENLKAQYLHMNAAYNAQRNYKHKQIESAIHLQQYKVEALYDEYNILLTDILPLNFDLVFLSKSAYAEGEGTIMEYLDATRSYSVNTLEMLEVKKKYYQELLELYKKADLKLGENL